MIPEPPVSGPPLASGKPRAPRADGIVRPSLDEARRLAFSCCPELALERIAPGGAAGRVVAETILADDDIVPFARAAMDGFAVRARDVAPGGPERGTELPLAEPIFAEAGSARLAPGTAAPIATGAPLPLGADAVVPVEATAAETAGRILLLGTCAPGDHVFEAGDDARAGDVLVARGDRLGPAGLALLAASGNASVLVRVRPRVTIVTTGSEIVGIAELPSPGQIRNSNASLLEAALAEAGANVLGSVHVADDVANLEGALEDALRASDLVVTTGGASVGSRDLVKAAFVRLGVRFAFTSVAVRPAKPTGFGSRGAVAVATLPGNPAAAFVALHELVIPALAAMSGATARTPQRVRARLAGTLRGKGERTFLAFCSLRVGADAVLEAIPLEDQCSSLTRIAASAAGLVAIAPGEAVYTDGALVEVDVIDWRRVVTPG